MVVPKVGIDYAIAFGAELVKQKIHDAKFPRMVIPIPQGPGHGSADISKIAISSFRF